MAKQALLSQVIFLSAVAFLAPFALRWALPSIFVPHSQQEIVGMQSSGKFVAAQEVIEPVRTDFLLLADQSSQAMKEVTSTVEVPWATLTFSSIGAQIEHIIYKKERNKDGRMPIFSLPTKINDGHDAVPGLFFVALDEETPLHFSLITRVDNADFIEIAYVGISPQGKLHKLFKIYKEICRIDLDLKLVPNDGMSMQPRIFVPSPNGDTRSAGYMPKGVVSTHNGLTTIDRKKIEQHAGWLKPLLFGVEDNYFLISSIHLPSAPIALQRTWFTEQYAKDGLTAIFEGRRVTHTTVENFSFYVGPKRLIDMKAVDEHLEDVFNADYFWPLSLVIQLFIYLLNQLYFVFKSYSFAFIALIILIRIVLSPILYESEESIKKRADMQAKKEFLRKKYKGDQQKLQQEETALDKEQGLAGMGNVVMKSFFIQMPMFVVISRVVSNSIELHQESFLWLPDLSARDPYYILPTLVVIGMMVQMAITGGAGQRTFGMVTAIIFGAFSAALSAGLVLYGLIGSVVGVVQTYLIRKILAMCR